MGSLQMAKTGTANEEDVDAVTFLKRNGYKWAKVLSKTPKCLIELYERDSAAYDDHRANPSPFGVDKVVVKRPHSDNEVSPLRLCPSHWRGAQYKAKDLRRQIKSH